MSAVIWHRNFAEYEDDYIFHPGYYLEEFMHEFECLPDEFASRLGTDRETVIGVVNGEKSVTAPLASKIAGVSGMPAGLLLSCQKKWDALKEKEKNDA